MVCRIVSALLFMTLIVCPAMGKVTPHSLFSSGVVLQCDREAPIWGKCAAGAEITVTVDKKISTARADADGRWIVRLAPHAAGGPFTLRISETRGDAVDLDDVYFGEVWLASGQSNMQWTFSNNVQDKEKELAAADDPLLRQFTVKKGQAKQPAADVSGKWLGASRENLLADGVDGCSAVGYFFGRALRRELKIPVGIINASVGSTSIEGWSPKGGYYNNMIHPLAPFAFRGVIWYQGEKNVGMGAGYTDATRSQVQAWRKLWDQGEFPYYFVQLAPYTYSKGSKTPSSSERLPIFWEAQANITSTVSNTGMIVINDLVENVGNIHPSNKQEVGERLARLAMARDYGRKDVVCSGPTFSESKSEGKSIRIRFTHIHTGLVSRDGRPLTDFQIASDDRKFQPAEARIDGDTIVVSSAAVEKPVAVRFAWNERATPNLANRDGFPAGSFRTDNWTTGEKK